MRGENSLTRRGARICLTDSWVFTAHLLSSKLVVGSCGTALILVLPAHTAVAPVNSRRYLQTAGRVTAPRQEDSFGLSLCPTNHAKQSRHKSPGPGSEHYSVKAVPCLPLRHWREHCASPRDTGPCSLGGVAPLHAIHRLPAAHPQTAHFLSAHLWL